MPDSMNVPVRIPQEVIELAAVRILTDEDEQRESDRVLALKSLRKKVEEWRQEAKAPHLEAGRQIDAAARPILARFDQAIEHYSGPIIVYKRARIEAARAEQERREAAERAALARIAEEQERLRAEAAEEARLAALDDGAFSDEAEAAARRAAETAPTIQVAPVKAVPIPTGASRGIMGTASIRQTLVITVVDKAAVPECYKVVNEAAIRSDYGGGIREIPGIAFSFEDTLTGRARRG